MHVWNNHTQGTQYITQGEFFSCPNRPEAITQFLSLSVLSHLFSTSENGLHSNTYYFLHTGKFSIQHRSHRKKSQLNTYHC